MKEPRRPKKKTAKDRDLRAAAEKRLARAWGIKPEKKGPASHDLVHELQVHQIELEMQNEELKRIQLELEESRRGYIDLFDFAPVGYVVLTREEKIAEANLAAASLLAVDRPVLLGGSFRRFVEPGDLALWERHFREALQQGGKRDCELRLRRPDGSGIHVRLECTQRGLGEQPAGIRTAITDITELKLAEAALRGSVREKETLVREIHHRVKNNMQVISSLLNIQVSFAGDEEARRMLKNAQARIRTMALVHEKLYRSDDLSRIDFGQYLSSLAVHIFRGSQIDPSRIRLETDLETLFMDIQAAVPCGLIVNELVANSLEHAFPGTRPGRIRVAMRRGASGEIVLRVEDDGVGLPPGLDFRKTESLGLQIINLLVSQIDGRLEVDREAGTAVEIRFREPASVPRR